MSEFRRNQTISSYRQNTKEESERSRAHNLANKRNRLGLVLLASVSVVLLAGFLLWQLIVQITVITSTKPLSVPFNGQEYTGAINDFLMINPTQRLRAGLNAEELSSFVSSKHPEVESVTLKGGLRGPATGDFSITFRTPVAGWSMGGKQYFVDKSGVVFERNYYSAPTIEIVDESGVSAQQGAVVASNRLLAFLGRVVAQAQGRGYVVQKAVLPANTTRTLDLYFKDVHPFARLNIDRGAGEQVEDFQRAYNFITNNNIGAGYVDVRVGGRAAYK